MATVEHRIEVTATDAADLAAWSTYLDNHLSDHGLWERTTNGLTLTATITVEQTV